MGAPMKICFREIRESDSLFLFEVFYFARVNEFEASGWEPSAVKDFLAKQFNWQHSYYQRAFPEASFQFIEVDGVRAGRFYVDCRDEVIHILDLALIPAFRRQGLGAAILGRLAEEADATGRSLRLEVEPQNPVQYLCRRLGFQEGARHGFYLTLERPPAPLRAGGIRE